MCVKKESGIKLEAAHTEQKRESVAVDGVIVKKQKIKGSSDQQYRFSLSARYIYVERFSIVIMKGVGGPTAEETNNKRKKRTRLRLFFGGKSICWSSSGPRKYVIY